MIFLQVFLGILAALFVLRLIIGFRFRRMGFHRGHHGPRGRGMHFWRLYRQLDLSREQKDQLRQLFRDLRQEAAGLRGDMPRELARILGGEAFDRITAERMADERVALLVRMKDRALDTMERAHAILTPAQRARLAAAF
ncbi:MAG: Spy/CpxP family protein refolding chaperone [Myxococcota bacterium]